MNFRLRLAEAIGGKALEGRITEASEQAVKQYKESVPLGMGIDTDEHLYRRAGRHGTTVRRLPHHILDRSRELSWRAYILNAMARRLIDMDVDYLVGEGVSVDSSNEDVRRVLNRFWHDPVNNFPHTLPRRVTSLLLFGEQHYPVTVLPQTGHVRLSYCDPRDIVTVVLDPENAAFPCGLIARRSFGYQESFRLRIIGADDEFLSAKGREVMREFTDGEAFSFRINCLPNSDRGQPDLISQLDWLDNYEEGLFDYADRTRMLLTFLYDLEITGGDPQKIEEELKKFEGGSPGSAYAHNENVKLNTLSPDMRGQDKSNAWRLIKNHILGSKGKPEHWYGEGDSANRATAMEMGAPTLKSMTRKQLELKEMITSMLAYAVRQAIHAGYIPGRDIDIETVEELIQVKFPELSVRDVQKAASAYQSVTQGIMTMLPQRAISEETALELLSTMHDHFGVSVSAAEEKERLGIGEALEGLRSYVIDPESGETLQQMAEALRAAGNGGSGE